MLVLAHNIVFLDRGPRLLIAFPVMLVFGRAHFASCFTASNHDLGERVVVLDLFLQTYSDD